MPAALMLNPDTGGYHIAMPDHLGNAAYLVDERGQRVNVAWEFGNTGFQGVGAEHAMQLVVARFERVDEIFRRMP